MFFICGLSPGAKERLKEIADEEKSDTTPNKSKEKTKDNKKSAPDVNIQKPKSPPSQPLNPQRSHQINLQIIRTITRCL